MSYPRRHTIALVTDASGNFTGYTPVVSGRVVSIRYVKNDFDNGSGFTVTGADSGVAIWAKTSVDASVTVYPAAAAVTTAGVASTLTETPVRVADERIKVVIAGGGNVKSGTLHVIVE